MNQNDVNELMSRIQRINMTPVTDLTSMDIDDIIAEHRYQRLMKAQGKVKAPRQAAEKQDLRAILGLSLGQPTPKSTPQVDIDPSIFDI